MSVCAINTLAGIKRMEEKVKYIGWYQVIGGILGNGLLIWTILTNQYLSNGQVLAILGAILLFSFSIYCGILLIKGKRSGTKLSVINQFLQIINFSLLGYSYYYISGLQFSVGVDYTNDLLLKAEYTLSGFQFSTNESEDQVRLLINIVPLVIINMLFRLSSENIELEKKEVTITNS